jgi:hypothetical protein
MHVDGRLHLGARRPHVLQEDGLAVAPRAERLGVRIEVDGAGEGVRDDQRRRREVVRAHLGVHAAFEVAVAAQHGRRRAFPSSMAFDTGSGSGPLLPMHVVQP